MTTIITIIVSLFFGAVVHILRLAFSSDSVFEHKMELLRSIHSRANEVKKIIKKD
jgi:hypothetical protein